METRLRVLLLSVVALATGCSWMPWRKEAPEPVAAEAAAGEQVEATPTVIEPQVVRQPVKVSKLDTENWEVGGSVGSMSVEDFEVNVAYGLRAAYHINEDFFAEAIVGRTDAGLSSYERLSGSAPLLTDEERQFTYYSLGFGWNALPGEIFLGGKRAYNSAVYVTAGAGSTKFAGDDRFTVTLGTGCRVLLNDWLALHLDVRDHILDVDVLGSKKSTHNFETTLGLTAFF